MNMSNTYENEIEFTNTVLNLKRSTNWNVSNIVKHLQENNPDLASLSKNTLRKQIIVILENNLPKDEFELEQQIQAEEFYRLSKQYQERQQPSSTSQQESISILSFENEEEEEKIPQNMIFKCEIEDENKAIDDYLGDLECKHQFCRQCIYNWIKVEIETNQRLPRCPKCLEINGTNTIQIISQNILELILNDHLSIHYYKISVNTALNEEMVYQCPSPDCSNRVVLAANHNLKSFICTKCWTESCITCKKIPYHYNQTCEEYKQHQTDIEKKDEEDLKELIKQKGWKNCPGCNIAIERLYGCFHMKCLNCKTDFCDACGEKLDSVTYADHFNIGKCPLWNSEKDLLYSNS